MFLCKLFINILVNLFHLLNPVKSVYPPQTASLALLAAMQTVDLLLLALPGMLREKEQ